MHAHTLRGVSGASHKATALTSPTCTPLFVLPSHSLAVVVGQIDSIQRKDRKRHADSTWARSNAEALGITLSDDSGDEGMADLQHGAIKASAAAAAAGAAAGARRGKKRKQDALAAAAAGLDGDSRVGQCAPRCCFGCAAAVLIFVGVLGLWFGGRCTTELRRVWCTSAAAHPALRALAPVQSATTC